MKQNKRSVDMNKDRNCGCGNNFAQQMPYQPMMPMPPVMPLNYGNQYNPYGVDMQTNNIQTVEQRLQNIEKRLAILEANLNSQPLNNNFNSSNYQII